MSSETVLFDVEVPGEVSRNLVARIAPDPAAEPVFQRYDMELQFRTMEMVKEHTDVPVPIVHWLETDATAIGAPFFVMERIEGIVPPDVMPYTFGDNWFFDASLEQQELLEHRAIEVLAALHELAPEGPASSLVPPWRRTLCSPPSRQRAAGLLRVGGRRREAFPSDRTRVSIGSKSTGLLTKGIQCSVGGTHGSGT